MKKIKVLVVDDSAFMRKVIGDLLHADPELEVVGSAKNGLDALEKISQLKPDVLTLDVEMPLMDGITTLAEIQKRFRLPVIMLSSQTTKGAQQTLIALEKGAFDFVTKPSGSISLDLHKVQDELIEKLKCAYASGLARSADRLSRPKRLINSKKHSKAFNHRQNDGRHEGRQPVKSAVVQPTERTGGLKQLILIGTSTGGPTALQRLFSSFPPDPLTAILVVQHMPPSFTASLAKRLQHMTRHEVKEAEDGEMIAGGNIYIAPGGLQMAIQTFPTALHLHVYQGPPRGGHCPSVDVLYESAAAIAGLQLITVTLTGMGKDGLEGLKTLTASRDVYNIAEDASTCVVYGMPKAVIEAQLVDEVIPLDEIPAALKRLTQS